MKRNFYLQHSLMAMNDPRMRNLTEKEGLKGLGAYWIIIEKLALLPEPRAQLEYLRPFCSSKKISFAYLTKIILEYKLFKLEEDGYFSAEELNPVKKREKKMAKNDGKLTDSKPKNDEKQQKMSGNNSEIQAAPPANSLENKESAKQTTDSFKENIKDIITSSAKEKETAADDDANFPIVRHSSLTVCDGSGRPQPTLQPVRPWQELVDELTERTPWLEAVCMQSGYGTLLMRHIKEAVGCFKQHIEIYDKWHDLLTQSDARRYFVNYTKTAQTSQILHANLLAIDARQQSAAPPDPHRYEQLVNGRRTYLGCPIPDDAPPRPNATAFWNEATHSWSSQNATPKHPKRHT